MSMMVVQVRFQSECDEREWPGFEVGTRNAPLCIDRVALRRHTWAAHAGVGCEHIGWLMMHINGQQVDHANRAALLTTVSVPGNTREVTLRKPICGTFEMDGLF